MPVFVNSLCTLRRRRRRKLTGKAVHWKTEIKIKPSIHKYLCYKRVIEFQGSVERLIKLVRLVCENEPLPHSMIDRARPGQKLLNNHMKNRGLLNNRGCKIN